MGNEVTRVLLQKRTRRNGRYRGFHRMVPTGCRARRQGWTGKLAELYENGEGVVKDAEEAFSGI